MDANVEHAKELAELSMTQEVEESIKTLGTLQSILSENPQETEIAVSLARGLRSLCGRAPGVQAKQAAYAGLEQLWAEYGETHAVLDELAKGLALLIANLDEMSGFVYKARLQGLTFGYPELEEVIAEFQKTGN